MTSIYTHTVHGVAEVPAEIVITRRQDEGFPVEDIEVMNRKALLWQATKLMAELIMKETRGN